MCDVFVLLPSFPFSLLWQRQQTFVSLGTLNLALPLVDSGKKDTFKGAFATEQQRFKKGMFRSLWLLLKCKIWARVHPSLRLLRLWLPSPPTSHSPCRQTSRQWPCQLCSQCAASLPPPSWLPTYQPTGATGLSLPWHGLGHCALLSPLELKSSHLETPHSQHQRSSEANAQTCNSKWRYPLRLLVRPLKAGFAKPIVNSQALLGVVRNLICEYPVHWIRECFPCVSPLQTGIVFPWC